jgi:Ulp1 family protease
MDTDIFSKRIIVIPVNKDKNWFLFEEFNAALVSSEVHHAYKEVPFMLFLDPLEYHSRAEIVKNERSWLNSEWNRKHKSSLNASYNLTMESFSLKGMSLCILQS